MSPTVTLDEIHCECCGIPFSMRPGTIVLTARDETSILCELCERLIGEGMLRKEIVDGAVRYRQWHFEWKPGELMPAVPAPLGSRT